MPLSERMLAYYESVRPIRDRIAAWERRRKSIGARVFGGFVVAMAVGAAGSIVGLLPYVFVTRTSGPLSPDIPTAISQLVLPWLIFLGIFTPLFWISWRWWLRTWPPVPPSTLTPDQLSFVAAFAATIWIDKYRDSQRPEYLQDALSELASVFDPDAEPLWRWDGDEFIARRRVVKETDPGFRVTLSRRQLKSDQDFLRTSWPSAMGDLRRLGRVQERASFFQPDPAQSRLVAGLLAVGPKVLDQLRRTQNVAAVRDILGSFCVLTYGLIAEQLHGAAEQDRADVVAAAREVAERGELLPVPPEVDTRKPEGPGGVARAIGRRALTRVWDLTVIRLVARALLVGLLVALGVVGLRASVLPKLDDNTAALAILTSVTVGAIGWEQLSRGGRNPYPPDSGQ